MKSKFLKKLFAITLALSVIAVPTLSLAATNIVCSTDFSSVPNGEYSIGDFSTALLNSGFDVASVSGTAGQLTAAKYTVGEDGLTITSNTYNAGLRLDVTLKNSIATGTVAFDYEVSNTVGKIYFRVNGTDIIESQPISNGAGFAQISTSFPFEVSNPYTSASQGNTNKMHLRILVSRADTSSNWNVVAYDSYDNTVLCRGTLANAPLTTFAVGRWWETGCPSIKIHSLSASTITIDPAELEDDTDLLPLDDPKVIFSEAIAPENDATYILKKLVGGVPTGDAVPVKTSWSQDKTELTVTPLTFLEEGKSYSLAFTGMTGDGTAASYDGELTFTTKAADLFLSAPVALSYKDGENNAATVDAANKVQATATVSNAGGATREIGGIIGIYYPAGHPLAGKLMKVEVVPFAAFTDASIPFSVTYDAGEVTDFTSVVEAFVLNKTSNGIMAIE